MAEKKSSKNPIESRFFWLKKMRTIILFSFIINLLHLAGPLFMMQVYDRVLASASIPTLVGLAAITVLLYAFYGVLEYIRGQALRAHGEITVDQFAEKAYHHSVLNNCEKEPSKEKKRALADVNTLRGFLTSPIFPAFFDLPWSPIFLIFIFALHPGLGMFAIIACVILAVFAFINERFSSEKLKEASGLSLQSDNLAQSAQRNAITLRGNGMIKAMYKQWQANDQHARETAMSGSRINNGFSNTTKTLRLMIQSLILGLGAYYVIQGEMSPGSIIAASIVFTRVLSPLERLLGSFSSVVNARESWNNVKTWLFENDNDEEKEELPAPTSSLSVQELSVLAPGNKTKFIINNVQFSLKAGDVLGISGPSGSGKSTLAKAMVAAWPAAKGKVCLDGADLNQWSRTSIGQHIGYLPQEIELFEGTVAENISRFSDNASFDQVLSASELAGTHQLILELEEGYNTKLGQDGQALSSGQKQRISLACALYGDPFLVVLDEPNSNLDAEGEQRLNDTIEKLKARNAIVVFISHRPQLLEKASKLLIMQDGEMKAFGSPEAIMREVQKQRAAQQVATRNNAVPTSKDNQ